MGLAVQSSCCKPMLELTIIRQGKVNLACTETNFELNSLAEH
uniref:Uncharacterized protein n=1 Tax=Rhizophora mucronata TaxID=61149 RepID=A0A2P2QJQ3_RHIMU